MKTKILSKTKNPFLKREEIVMEITAEGSPSNKAIIEETKKDEELVVVKRITTSFGTQTCTADLVIYDTKEAREQVEVIPKKVRKKLEEERKAAEEAAAKKAEEEKKAAEEAAAKEKEESEKAKTEETKETTEEKA